VGTVAANGQFGPDTFKVQTNSERHEGIAGTVDAKFLKDINGNYVIDPLTNKPYIAPLDFDPANTIAHFSSFVSEIYSDFSFSQPKALANIARGLIYGEFGDYFKRGGAGDLQRNYNGQTNVDFVSDFQAVCTENLKSGHSGGEVRLGSRVYE
jgi:hypothetical protein